MRRTAILVQIFALSAAAALLPAAALAAPRASAPLPFGFAVPRTQLTAYHARTNVVAHGTVDMRFVPQALPGAFFGTPRTLPLMTGMDPRSYVLMKRFAAHNPNAPIDLSPPDDAGINPFTTPLASPKFGGMNDGSACKGCEPPDMAVAASTQFEVQGVNTSFAVYGPTGALQSGWPKTAVKFFNIPNPPNNCDPSGPFVSDPRAFYDPNDGRFWVAILQVEGNFGVAPKCPPQSDIWVAVSKTSDPRGAWNVYEANMDFSNSGFALDYTQLGFDTQAVYIGGNMFGTQALGDPFEYDEVFFASKALMEAGSSVTFNGFFGFAKGTAKVDTVQPVLTETSSTNAPGVEFLINTDNFGTGGCSAPCRDITVWAIFHPLSSPSATGVNYSAFKAYTDAPQADEPGCTACIETIDTRISGQPVYTAARDSGLISFALESGVTVGSLVDPAVLWGEVHPTLSGGTITGITPYQSGYIKGSGDMANSFGVTMASNDGSLWIANDRMSSTLNPGIVYRVQRLTDAPGVLENTVTLKGGVAPTFDSRWGDYSAMSLDGLASGAHSWMSLEFSGSTGDWATFIGRVL